MSVLILNLQALRDLLGRYAQVFAYAWRERSNTSCVEREPHELEFLPDALALQETPVSPLPRMTMWILISFAGVALAWSIIGKIEVVAVAQGKIVLGDRSKTIQSMDAAVVKTIFVRDGQSVKAGDVLVELDSTDADADVLTIEKELTAAKLEVMRNRALIEALESGRIPRLNSDGNPNAQVYSQAEELVKGRYEDFHAKTMKLAADIEAQQADLSASREIVNSLEQSLPISTRRTSDLKKLSEENLVSKHDYLVQEQTRLEQEGNLAAQRKRVDSLDAAIRSLRRQQASVLAETRKNALESIEQNNQKISSFEQDLVKAKMKGQLLTLTSPVNGTVQQLAVHTVGGVVTTAQPLMTIVPNDGALEVEAVLENKDVGFVREGQDAIVKVATFPYTKYGTIDGLVTSVSRDAVDNEKLGPIYQMRVKLKRSAIIVDGNRVGLGAGMATTVEVKTAKRRLIEYFLSPLIQHSSESFRER
jgi:hemolysin D